MSEHTNERTETHACDLISRQALMKEFSDFVRASNNSDFARTPTWNDAVSLVESMPSAQPVRHGRFIGTEYDGYADGSPVFYEWKCSECGCIFEDEEPTYNYCPNCGAKMDEVT